jgi:hypothetical protein
MTICASYKIRLDQVIGNYCQFYQIYYELEILDSYNVLMGEISILIVLVCLVTETLVVGIRRQRYKSLIHFSGNRHVVRNYQP